jgi:hypothetical protein
MDASAQKAQSGMEQTQCWLQAEEALRMAQSKSRQMESSKKKTGGKAN